MPKHNLEIICDTVETTSMTIGYRPVLKLSPLSVKNPEDIIIALMELDEVDPGLLVTKENEADLLGQISTEAITAEIERRNGKAEAA